MGKNLKYGEFTFAKPKERPTSTSYRAMKDGGSCYAKGGAKKPAPKATSTVQKTVKREPEAIVRKEVALLRKAGAPKAIIEHEMSEMTTPAAMKDGGYAKGGQTKMQKKVGRVMSEFKEGSLHSGKNGPVVKNPKQAIAIALSEGRKAVRKYDGGQITEQERANLEKERADSRVLQQLAKKYGAQEEAIGRRGLMEAARAMGSKSFGGAMTEGERRRLEETGPTGSAVTESERARLSGRKNYATGGSVEAKLKKHASMPASVAHGSGAAKKLAKGGVPTFSKVPKIGRLK